MGQWLPSRARHRSALSTISPYGPQTTAWTLAHHQGMRSSLHPHQPAWRALRLLPCSPPVPELAVPMSRRTPSATTRSTCDPLAFAVRSNRALLRHFCGVGTWDIPARYLCPPIPGRADYLHYLAIFSPGRRRRDSTRHGCARARRRHRRQSCLSADRPRRVPLALVGSDIERGALASAQAIIDANEGLADAIGCATSLRPPAFFTALSGATNVSTSSKVQPAVPRIDGRCPRRQYAQMEEPGQGSGSGNRRYFSASVATALGSLRRWRSGFVRRMIEESADSPSNAGGSRPWWQRPGN